MTQQNSTILGLPYIQPAQAQKHVTHNEAIRLLDVLVQGVAAEAPRIDPPATPEEGARYLVDAGATGEWAGRDGAVAVRWDDAWTFVAPKPGWHMRLATGGARTFDGTAWVSGDAGRPDRLGVNTDADATNRLAVSSEATLLTGDGAGHQLKVNKIAPGDTASLLFQTGFSGRAEMGTTGEEAFSVKVSGDGADWHTALRADPSTGAVSFPSGARVPARLELGREWRAHPDNRWVCAGPEGGPAFDHDAGDAADPALDWTHLGPFVPAGGTVTRLRGSLRRLSDEITGVTLRLYAQHGPWPTGWAGDGATGRELLLDSGVLPLRPGFARVDLAGGPTTWPRDAHLLLFVRPEGAITAPRRVVGTLVAEVLPA